MNAAALGALGACLAAGPAAAAPIDGVLRPHPLNARYFTNNTGRAILLAGSHTWDSLQDMGETDPPAAFDFNAYLDLLVKHHHNFIRLWRWELTIWDTSANGPGRRRHFTTPQPWPRTGKGTALDGKPKFDLARFDAAFFRRLRTRVDAARQRGIYVSVMLFEGWGLQFVPHAWKAHPFNRANNVNGIDGDVDGDGKGLEVHALASPDVTRVQEAYIRKVVDTLKDLDNVLYEVSNENHPPSTEWQYHVIRTVQRLEAGLPRRHPVGMTFQFQGGSNRALFESPADWVSPNPDAPDGFSYSDNPPPADGRKVVLSDTDHLWGIGGTADWAWKSVTRGHNPLFMDPYRGVVLAAGDQSRWEPLRQALGVAVRLSERLDLADLLPRGDLVSSTYCLARPGKAYVAYAPDGGALTVDLTEVGGKFASEWVDAVTGVTTPAETVEGGARATLTAPGPHAFVLVLQAR